MNKRELFINKYPDIKLNLLNKYFDFITMNALPMSKSDFYTEKHHILPRKMFPEYEDDIYNLVNLSAKHHIRAHYYLYKALPNQQTILSLNMMINRGSYNPVFDLATIDEIFDKYEEEYEEFRIKVSECISKANKGRHCSEENKRKTSIRMKNRINVYDKNGNCFQVLNTDERYLSGELRFCCVGRKLSEETKRMIGEHGLKGKMCFTDGKITKYSDTPIEGMWRGLSDGMKEKMSIANTNRGYVYNTKTGQTIRYDKNKELPEDCIWHREKKGLFVGFDKINENIKVYNLKTGYKGLRPKKEIDWNDDIFMNGIFYNSIAVIYDNYIFISYPELFDYLVEFKNIKIPQALATSMITLEKSFREEAKLIFKTKRGVNELFKYNGKKISDVLDFKFAKINELVYNDNIKVYHSKKAREKYGN